MLRRRELLQRGAVTGLGLGLLPAAGRAAHAVVAESETDAGAPRVRRQVRLGRTELQVSDIGFGSSSLSDDEDLVRYALDRGITYFDTAESYKDGRSEETIGRALAGRRDEVVLASKVGAGADESRNSLMRRLDGSLRRLRTDRIEVYFNHAVNAVDRLRNDEWGEFASRAKAAGKIRFTGMSGHGGRLAACCDHALDHDLADVLLLGFNYGQDPAFSQRFTGSFDFVAVQPELPRVIAKARARDVGVVAMKTLRGARLNDLRAYETAGATYAQAAFRWVLAHEHVNSLVVTMRSREMIDEYLGASGAQQVSRDDLRILAAYDERNGATQCRYGCGACESACPESVPIGEVLRTRMYDADYGDRALAQTDYARLERGAEACLTCAHLACTGACPHGLDVPTLTRDTAQRLGSARGGRLS